MEVFLSLPCALGERGIMQIVKNKLTDSERTLLQKSAKAMNEVQTGLKF